MPQRQSDGLADSLARTKTAPAKKEAPATLEGAHGAEGLLWAEKCPINPPTLRLRPTDGAEQVGASIRPASRFIIG